jgi:hypothetical protein
MTLTFGWHGFGTIKSAPREDRDPYATLPRPWDVGYLEGNPSPVGECS